MGTTVNRQKAAKADMDQKLALSRPDRALLEELAIACSKQPGSQQATFQYAFALAKSSEASELRYAITLLDGLVLEGFEHQIDCMFGAATALYLLGDFDESRVSQLYPSAINKYKQRKPDRAGIAAVWD
jgi:mitochondrial fission 1 protein